MGCVEWTETYCDEGVKFVSYQQILITKFHCCSIRVR